jgi:hypothetical protein
MKTCLMLYKSNLLRYVQDNATSFLLQARLLAECRDWLDVFCNL